MGHGWSLVGNWDLWCSWPKLVELGPWSKTGSGKPICGLGPTWPWGLVDFPLWPHWISPKGPKGPTDRIPWPVEAIGGLKAPKKPFSPHPLNIRGLDKRPDGG
ncbi:hypothetical protein O181_075525 [Austropuccinia psidii MF-1]|uniref:Uncharacterized protein n=1 Tax=Austropuccinia psidii MF-1 TaxID=1389203 RepID=A0A9Q3IE43_9BASI|nr:hypothetical protein [Austropuccinia psidii MF-1]